MPRRSSPYRTPREWVSDGSWPDGTFAADSPTAVAYAVEISRRLERSMGTRSKAALAREANLERSTLYDILAGRSWPDAVTIAQLEQVLETRTTLCHRCAAEGSRAGAGCCGWRVPAAR